MTQLALVAVNSASRKHVVCPSLDEMGSIRSNVPVIIIIKNPRAINCTLDILFLPNIYNPFLYYIFVEMSLAS